MSDQLGPYYGEDDKQSERERRRDEKAAKRFQEQFTGSGEHPAGTGARAARLSDDERWERFRDSLDTEE